MDSYTGRSFEHRKHWVEDRLHDLAEAFAVSLYGYAVMSNHVHIVLRVDPTLAAVWSDVEVAMRWTRAFPTGDEQRDGLRVERLLADQMRLHECRKRLGNLSWFMRCLSEPIARRANREDHCKGRFWEGRFKCQALLDERAVVAAMTYVDLNPIRAGLCTRLEQARHTSIVKRLAGLRANPHKLERGLRSIAGNANGPQLSVSVAAYIELVDWTGRLLRPDKRGLIPAHEPAALARLGIPAHEPAALARLGIESQRWEIHVRGVGSGYWRAVGSVEDLLDKARELGQHWLKGLGTAQRVAAR